MSVLDSSPNNLPKKRLKNPGTFCSTAGMAADATAVGAIAVGVGAGVEGARICTAAVFSGAPFWS
jgi:hypothetical protein